MKKSQSLDGNWTLYYAPEASGCCDSYDTVIKNEISCISAEVPGCVQLDLYRADVLCTDEYAEFH